MRIGLTMACALALAGNGVAQAQTAAQGDLTALARSAFESHRQICGPAMDDPAAFIDSLPARFPPGTHATRATPDGQIFRAYISTEGGRFSTHYSRYLLSDIGHENCATYLQDPQGFELDASAVAAAFRAVAAEYLRPDQLAGGQMPKLSGGYGDGNDILQEDPDSYEFISTGLVGGADVMASSHVIGGYISIVSQRDLRRPDEMRPRVTVPAAFADHCFSPFLTAATAAANLPARHDFYDLDPFDAANAVSPALGRAATPGTDRRCEVAFDGDDLGAGIAGVLRGLNQEGIATEAEVPADFPTQEGAAFVAARQLNPARIAVVQVGTRPGPSGTETFINVERLLPLQD